MFLTCQEARKRAVATQKPILIEVSRVSPSQPPSVLANNVAPQALSYRSGHHSTSDDSTAYRSASTSLHKLASPHARLRAYLATRNKPRSDGSDQLWSPEIETALKKNQKQAVMLAFKAAEKEKKPRLDEMWADVYAPVEGAENGLERPQREQREELKRLAGKWGRVQGWKEALETFDGGAEAVSKW